MDPIADLLSAVRIQGAFYGRIHVDASWVPPHEAGLHARFGLILHGHAALKLSDTVQPIPLSTGDFFLLAPGRGYALSPHGANALSAVIAGRFGFNEAHTRPLADLFPPLILIRGAEAETPPLQKTIELLVSEVDASTQGSEAAVQHLSNLLLIQALRSHIQAAPESTGWLHALSDSHIGAALNSMHQRIEHPWTVASLASEAGMSRSAFALRFKELLSESPLEYLTRWRMYRGSDLLRESDRKLADVAQAVGYDSDGAFHKAFKRVLGIAPGEYRRSVGTL